jgi:hypothetical protein
MNPMAIVKKLMDWGPMLFALGFLAPLVAQSIERAQIGEPSTLAPLQIGLLVALPLGLIAKLRGRWI